MTATPSDVPPFSGKVALTPIATVHSCFGGKFGAPRQPGLCPSAWGRLVFQPPFRVPEAVRGIEGFSHLWLIFGFHQTAGRGWSPTVRPPRLGGNARVGVFASRSTFRPNPLGLSLVRLEGVEQTASCGSVLLLGGIDLINGTPVYDIKPYLPYAEAPGEATGGFASAAPDRLPVEVSPAAAGAFAALPDRDRALVREALALDPRPSAARHEPGRVHGATLCGHEARFTVEDGVCRIVEIVRTGSRP